MMSNIETLAETNSNTNETVLEEVIKEQFSDLRSKVENVEISQNVNFTELNIKVEQTRCALEQKLGNLESSCGIIEVTSEENINKLRTDIEHRLDTIASRCEALEASPGGAGRSEREEDLDLRDKSDETKDYAKVVTDNNGDETKVRVYLQESVDSSSLHGLPRIFGTRTVWEKVFWCTVVLVSIGLVSWQLVTLTFDYYAYSVYIDVQIYTGRRSLPQITVCNSYPFAVSKLSRHELFRDRPFLAEELEDLSEETKIELSYNASELIHFEMSNGTFTRRSPPVLHYSPYRGNCYAVTPPDDVTYVMFYVNTNTDDYRFYQYNRDAEFVLTQPGVFPFSQPSETVILTPGMITSVELSLEVINRLNETYGNCQDNEHEFTERTGLPFSQDDCENECRISNTMAKCGCTKVDVIQPNYAQKYKITRLYGTSNCTVDRYTCVFNEKAKPMDKTNCPCRPKCRTTFYRIDKVKSHSTLTYFDFLCGLFNSSCNHYNKQEWVKTHVASVSLEFKPDSLNKEFTEIPLYPISRFMSDIGGTMGFYMGASVLTICEAILVFFGVSMYIDHRKDRPQPV